MIEELKTKIKDSVGGDFLCKCPCCEVEGQDFERPVTLADVLRAIQNRTDGKLPRNETFFKLFDKQAYSWDTIYAYFCVGGWNLAANLDEQSDEVILFLHSILCGK